MGIGDWILGIGRLGRGLGSTGEGVLLGFLADFVLVNNVLHR